MTTSRAGGFQNTKTSAEILFSLPICVIMKRMIQLGKEKELPKRKHTRLKDFDYNATGAYFITICTDKKRQILSCIVGGEKDYEEIVKYIYENPVHWYHDQLYTEE